MHIDKKILNFNTYYRYDQDIILSLNVPLAIRYNYLFLDSLMFQRENQNVHASCVIFFFKTLEQIICALTA